MTTEWTLFPLSKDKVARILVPLFALLTLAPFMSSGAALLLGMLTALVVGNPHISRTRPIAQKLLTYSVVGLGAAMDLRVVGKVGAHGIGYTMAGIFLTFAVGLFLGRRFRVSGDTSLLVTVGTAICGGSAIAAAASAIRAKQEEVSIALATVFFLNAMALFLFPWIGHHFALSETQFGLWAALAIHDTSSVVGAALQYGGHALEIATTVKLARALWIIPVTFIVGMTWNRAPEEGKPVGKVKRPWFILGFVIAAALVTWVPELRPAGVLVSEIAKRTLVLTLFLIGCGLTRATLENVGLRPFLQGFTLWIIVGSATLAAICGGWIA